jgi:Asp-tRNA(Asn)/Glu-tRNA(Gln) amidotransferase A subunit family amidase
MLKRYPINKKTAALIAFGLYSCYSLVSKLKSLYRRRLLQRKASAKLVSRNSYTPTIPSVSAETESFILSQTAVELASAIRSGKVTSVECVSVYIKRAYTIGRSLSLTTEECFASALEEASKCDAEARSNHFRGVFHGVPFSVKDQIQMLGCNSTAGVAWRLGVQDTETAAVVQLMVDEGGIPFVRSNVPQTLFWMESANKIYGQAQNPWDRRRTTGGSSGGEAGLVAARCSPLGIGSDISGSIRFPAAFCGVYGLKPTPRRVSRKGVISANPSGVNIFDAIVPATMGPIGRSTEDLAQMMRVWLCAKAARIDREIVPQAESWVLCELARF